MVVRMRVESISRLGYAYPFRDQMEKNQGWHSLMMAGSNFVHLLLLLLRPIVPLAHDVVERED